MNEFGKLMQIINTYAPVDNEPLFNREPRPPKKANTLSEKRSLNKSLKSRKRKKMAESSRKRNRK